MTPETNPFYAEVARLLKLLAKKKLDDATAHRCVRDLRKLLTLSSNSVIIYETGKLTHMRGGYKQGETKKKPNNVRRSKATVMYLTKYKQRVTY
jgi:hypothetical protein